MNIIYQNNFTNDIRYDNNINYYNIDDIISYIVSRPTLSHPPTYNTGPTTSLNSGAESGLITRNQILEDSENIDVECSVCLEIHKKQIVFI